MDKRFYYSKDVFNDIDASILLNPFFDDWYFLVEDILLSDEFQKRKLFYHHKEITVWEHSIQVSFGSYVMSKYFGADPRICAVAGLLHDFYPYAWVYNDKLELLDGDYLARIGVKTKFFKRHGFVHASEAAINYVKFFPYLENKKITNSIKRHMFPLNIIPPRYIEGFVVTLVDKINSCSELPKFSDVTDMIGLKIHKNKIN